MWQWLKNKIIRRLNVRELTEADALKVYNILISHGDDELKDKVKKTLKTNAESAMGMFAMAAAWYGTELPQAVRDEIARNFSFFDLHGRNLMSYDGRYIELNVLAGALPEKMLMEHFYFDMEAKAIEAGVSLDDVRAMLRTHVKEITNDEVHFYKTLDVDKEFCVMSQVLGVGGVGDRGDGTYVCWSKLAVQNISKLMKEDKVFLDKFEFLKGLS